MPEQQVLLEVPSVERAEVASLPATPPPPRLKPINRAQKRWEEVDLEQLIGPEHPARALWQLVEQMKLDDFLRTNKSVAGVAGADRIDPRLLVSVWVYGYTLGIGEARELDRQLRQEPGLRWLSGGQEISYGTLARFRVEHGKAVEGLFTQLLGMLSRAGMVRLERVTVDGTKVEASCGDQSFRRQATLEEHLRQAEQVVNQLSTETGAAEAKSRQSAARQRAAREREARLKQALEELEQIRESKREAAKKEQARASETEPEARMMKHGDGGFAASYNLQTTADAEHKIVLNVELTQEANDQQQLQPAVERLRQQGPETAQVIVDGGYITQDNILAMAQAGVDLIGPQLNPEQQRQRNTQQALQRAGIAPEFGPGAFRILENGSALQCPAGKRLTRISDGAACSQYRANPSDCQSCPHRPQCCPGSEARSVKIGKTPEAVEAFHRRMKEEAAKQAYRLRGPTAEFPHAWLKQKLGLRKFHLRGLARARIEAWWAALTYNAQQWIRLCWSPDRAATKAAA
jgi:transposase